MLEEKIYKDYIEAFKKRDKKKSGFLSFLRSEFKNAAINFRKDKLDDDEALTVINKQKKRLAEAKEIIASSGRQEALGDIEKELELLDEYLPKPLTQEELIVIVDEAIACLGVSSLKDMGKVIKEVIAKTGPRADGKTVSQLVKDNLSSS